MPDPLKSLIARAGAYESWARTPDRSARTAPARRALMAKFEAQVDPDGTLTPQERAKRAEYAWRAHFARLAAKSAQARAKAKVLVQVAAAAEAELADLADAGGAS